MTGSARIQPAQITGVFGAVVKRYSMKLLGEVPEPMGVYFHNRPVLKAFLAVSGKAQKWSACEENLKSFAHMAVAAKVGCTWCLDNPATSMPTTRGWTRGRRARSRCGAPRTSSPRSSGTSWRSPRR